MSPHGCFGDDARFKPAYRKPPELEAALFVEPLSYPVALLALLGAAVVEEELPVPAFG